MSQDDLFSKIPHEPTADMRRKRCLELARAGAMPERYSSAGLTTTIRELLREGLVMTYGGPDRFVITEKGVRVLGPSELAPMPDRKADDGEGGLTPTW